MIIQLNPMIPVDIVAGAASKEAPQGAVLRSWPSGKGHAIALIDYSQEHFTLFKVAMDRSGEIWDVPQSHVRLQTNVSMGRERASVEEIARLINGVPIISDGIGTRPFDAKNYEPIICGNYRCVIADEMGREWVTVATFDGAWHAAAGARVVSFDAPPSLVRDLQGTAKIPRDYMRKIADAMDFAARPDNIEPIPDKC